MQTPEQSHLELQQETTPVVVRPARLNRIAATTAKVLAGLTLVAGLNGCESDPTNIPLPQAPAGPPGEPGENAGGTGGSAGSAGCGGSVNVGGNGGTVNEGGSGGTAGTDTVEVNVDVYGANIGNDAPDQWGTWTNLLNRYRACEPNCTEADGFYHIAHNQCAYNHPNEGKAYMVVVTPTDKNGNVVKNGPCRNYDLHTDGQMWGAADTYNQSSQTFGPYQGTVEIRYDKNSDTCPSHTGLAATESFSVDANVEQ